MVAVASAMLVVRHRADTSRIRASSLASNSTAIIRRPLLVFMKLTFRLEEVFLVSNIYGKIRPSGKVAEEVSIKI
jgi:hypothetical protein